MKKYAILTDENTKECSVGIGTDVAFYKSIGMKETEVEQGYDGKWYLAGFKPEKPQSEVNAERIFELKKKLAETDYVITKIAEGVATKEEYAEVIQARQKWREEINLLEG